MATSGRRTGAKRRASGLDRRLAPPDRRNPRPAGPPHHGPPDLVGGGKANAANTEKSRSAAQKPPGRFAQIAARILENKALFATAGSVIADWRAYRGRRLGPYFKVVFRQQGRQKSIYLGRSEELAGRVRQLLAELQGPRRRRLCLQRLRAGARAALRDQKEVLRRELAAVGITLRGWEFRGCRLALRAGMPRSSTDTNVFTLFRPVPLPGGRPARG